MTFLQKNLPLPHEVTTQFLRKATSTRKQSTITRDNKNWKQLKDLTKTPGLVTITNPQSHPPTVEGAGVTSWELRYRLLQMNTQVKVTRITMWPVVVVRMVITITLRLRHALSSKTSTTCCVIMLQCVCMCMSIYGIKLQPRCTAPSKINYHVYMCITVMLWVRYAGPSKIDYVVL